MYFYLLMNKDFIIILLLLLNNYNTRYALKKTFINDAQERILENNQSNLLIAVDLWKDLSRHLKDLPKFSFPRLLKQHLPIRKSES